jgi:glycosyltransferase involved in cell wall biosynthesis
MLSLNYISNLDVRQDGGGWDGMNKNVYQQLSKFADINLIDAINPKVSLVERVVSKIKRNLGLAAAFPALNSARLSAIARLVEKNIKNDRALNFYHGSTPWILVKNKLPYACYLDAGFHTYLSVYHTGNNYAVDWIIYLEKQFLENAKAVFFSSKWSLEQTKKNYALPGGNFHVAGLGGNLPQPAELPIKKQGNRFVFVGLDFEGKGGPLVAAAFRKLSESIPEAQITFVGAAPPPDVVRIPGVEYAGYLNKHKPEELKKFQTILSEAIALILPTSRDMTPLVIIEAGYYGCPAIASNAYGIPELIGNHGYLCNVPVQVADLVKAMLVMIERKSDSQNIRNFYTNKFTWDASGEIIKTVLTR